jgi:hypothetical protein
MGWPGAKTSLAAKELPGSAVELRKAASVAAASMRVTDRRESEGMSAPAMCAPGRARSNGSRGWVDTIVRQSKHLNLELNLNAPFEERSALLSSGAILHGGDSP